MAAMMVDNKYTTFTVKVFVINIGLLLAILIRFLFHIDQKTFRQISCHFILAAHLGAILDLHFVDVFWAKRLFGDRHIRNVKGRVMLKTLVSYWY